MTLVEVIVTTKEGDVYHFPSVLRDEVQKITGTRPSLFSSSQLVLVNVSGACLTLPLRIIERVTVEGVDLWTTCFNA